MEERLKLTPISVRQPLAGGRVLRNFSLQLGGELIGQAIAFATAIYLAHALDPHGFGVWVFASSVLLYFTIVIDGGTDTWGMREVAARPRRLRRLLSAIIRSRLVLGVAAAALVAVFSLFVDRDNRMALLLGLPILVAFMFNTAWAHRGLETGTTGLTVVLQRATWLVLAFLLIKTPADATRATLWQGISEGAGVTVLLIALLPRLRSQGRRQPEISTGSVMAHSWPLAVARALRCLTAPFAVVVLEFANSNAEVGYYGAALRIGTILVLVSTVFSNAAFPGLSRACRGPNQARVISAAMRLLFAVISPIAVGGIILAGPIIRAIFPPEFTRASVMLAILLSAYTAMAVSDLLRRILAARHQQRLDVKLTTLATAVSIAATLLLTTRYGGIGAAVAMLIGEVALVALSLWGVARTGPAVSVVREGYRPLAGALLMGVILALLPGAPLIVRIALGALVYLGWLRLIIGHLYDDLKRISDGR